MNTAELLVITKFSDLIAFSRNEEELNYMDRPRWHTPWYTRNRWGPDARLDGAHPLPREPRAAMPFSYANVYSIRDSPCTANMGA